MAIVCPSCHEVASDAASEEQNAIGMVICSNCGHTDDDSEFESVGDDSGLDDEDDDGPL